MKKKTNVGESLFASLEIDTFYNISEEMVEKALDSSIDNEIISEVPILKTIRAIYKAGASIEQYFYMKKLMTFLYEANKVTEKERSTFYLKEANRTNRTKLGEQLLNIINRVEDLKKAEMLGKAFRYFVKEEITKNMFLDLVFIIQSFKTHYTDELIVNKVLGHDIDYEIETHLLNCGILIKQKKNSGIQSLWTSESISKRKIRGVNLTKAGDYFVYEIISFSKKRMKKKHIKYLYDNIYKIDIKNKKIRVIQKLNSKDMLEYLDKVPFKEIIEVDRFGELFDKNLILWNKQLYEVE